MTTLYSEIMRLRPSRYYPLADNLGSAIAKDVGTNGADGTINGTITFRQSPLIQASTLTSALFDGTSGFVSIPTTGLPTGANVWTIGAWVRMPNPLPTTGSGFNGVISIGTNTAKEIGWLYYRTSTQKFRMDTADNTINSINTATANGIYLLIGTYDGATVKLYVNGVFQGSYSDTLAITYGTAQIGDDNGGDLWAGAIGHALILPSVLSLDQVQWLYRVGLGAGVFQGYDRTFN